MLLSNLFEVSKLNESYEDWNTGRWVHYTDHDMLMVAPKKHQFHQDPAGIYFFPERFQTYNGFWTGKKNAYSVMISPSARVLDLSKLDERGIHELVKQIGGYDEFSAYIKQYPPKDTKKMVDMAWEQMRMKMMMDSALWNKKLRRAGWDAVFDDTGSIHSVEVQLLVLDPRIVQDVQMSSPKLNVFATMQKIVQELRDVCAPYGDVTIEGPKRQLEGWSRKPLLRATVEVKRGEDYATFKIVYDPAEKRKTINIGLLYSQPRLNYGVGATFELATGKYQFEDLSKLNADLVKIFPPNSPDSSNTD